MRIISYIIEITNFLLVCFFNHSTSFPLLTAITQGQVFKNFHVVVSESKDTPWAKPSYAQLAVWCEIWLWGNSAQKVEWLLVVPRASSTLSVAFRTLHSVGPVCLSNLASCCSSTSASTQLSSVAFVRILVGRVQPITSKWYGELVLSGGTNTRRTWANFSVSNMSLPSQSGATWNTLSP